MKDSFSSPSTMDFHGAAKSGSKREKTLVSKFKGFGYTLVKKQDECLTEGLEYDGCVRITPNVEYLEDGFKFFLVDGFCKELQSYVELKGGDKSGTTEEKIFFDLKKIEDGIYADYRLIYIFEGKKEDDKCTRKFIRDLEKLKNSGNIYAQNVVVLKNSELNKEVLDSLR